MISQNGPTIVPLPSPAPPTHVSLHGVAEVLTFDLPSSGVVPDEDGAGQLGPQNFQRRIKRIRVVGYQ